MELEYRPLPQATPDPAVPPADGQGISDTLARVRAMSEAADSILDRAFENLDADSLLQRQGGGQ